MGQNRCCFFALDRGSESQPGTNGSARPAVPNGPAGGPFVDRSANLQVCLSTGLCTGALLPVGTGVPFLFLAWSLDGAAIQEGPVAPSG
mmetsp:Transcript_78685/g.130321  ORF Transcript_78685/g.130321 Transcript_78685/m.130321 type:complete len:89 (-) Transcript_78685:477-743(-)